LRIWGGMEHRAWGIEDRETISDFGLGRGTRHRAQGRECNSYRERVLINYLSH
jgi:hypothetical protein